MQAILTFFELFDVKQSTDENGEETLAVHFPTLLASIRAGKSKCLWKTLGFHPYERELLSLRHRNQHDDDVFPSLSFPSQKMISFNYDENLFIWRNNRLFRIVYTFVQVERYANYSICYDLS